MSNDLRFDLKARVEVFVTEMDIRSHEDFDNALAITDPTKRLRALRAIAVVCAQERVNEARFDGIEITAYATLSDVNIDRINWQELANEPHV